MDPIKTSIWQFITKPRALKTKFEIDCNAKIKENREILLKTSNSKVYNETTASQCDRRLPQGFRAT